MLASRTLQPAGYAAAEKKTGVCPSRANVSEESACHFHADDEPVTEAFKGPTSPARGKETVAAFFIACSLACAAFRKLYGEFLVLASRTLQPAGYAAAEKKTGVCPSRGNVSEESA